VSRLVVRDLPLVTHDSGLVGAASTRRAGRLSAAGQRWFALPIKRGGVTSASSALPSTACGPSPRRARAYGSIAELLGAAFDNARLRPAAPHRHHLAENFIHESPEVPVSSWALFPAGLRARRVGGDFSDIFQLDDTRSPC